MTDPGLRRVPNSTLIDGAKLDGLPSIPALSGPDVTLVTPEKIWQGFVQDDGRIYVAVGLTSADWREINIMIP